MIYPRFRYPNKGGVQEPLGLLYIATVLERDGHEVRFLDLSFRDELPDLADEVKDVDFVGISSSTALFGRALETLKAIKDKNPHLPVALGGPHATALPAETVKAGFDVAVVGEGEKTILAIAEAFEKEGGLGTSALSKIPAIAFKSGDKIIVNPQGEFISDLDSLPHPDRALIDYQRYFSTGLKQAGIVAMRGCPFRCAYCKPMQEHLFGRKIRRRSARDVASEVDTVARNIIDRVLFRDDAFTTNSVKWFHEFGATLQELKTPLWGWVCQGRVDQITPELLDAMKSAGLKMIAFGVESGSQRILDYYRKGITPEQTERAFKLCKERGIATHAFVMVGAPIERWEDVEATIRLIERIKPNSVSPSITTPAPGTDLYHYALSDGSYNITDWTESDYMSNTKPLKLKYLSEEQVIKAKEILSSLGLGYGE